MDLREIMMVHADAAVAFAQEEDKLLDDEHKHRSDMIKPLTPITPLVDRGRKNDKAAEVAQEEDDDDEKDGKKVGKQIASKEGKKMKWWEKLLKSFAPIVNFISKAFTAFVAYKAFDWLSNPDNQKNAQTVLKAVSGIVGAAAKIAGFGVFQIMEGVTRVFGTNPDSKGIGKVFDKLFGVLQVFGGLGSLWAASRLLMPWKLVGDYKKMKKLGDTLKKIKNFFQRKPNIPRTRVTRSGNRTRSRGTKPRKPGSSRVTYGKNSKPSLMQRAKQFGQKKLSQVKNLKNNVVTKVKGLPKTLSKMKGNVMNMGKNIGNFGKNLLTRGKDFVGKAKNFGMDAIEKGKNLYKGASEWATKNVNRMKNLATKVKGGVFDWGKKIGAKMNQLKEMVKNPKAMFKPVMDRIKNTIKPIIEKNPNIKKVLSLKNAKTGLKNAKDFAIKNVKIAMKSKEMANLSKFLKEAKGRVKIGGIDKVIAAVMGLIDYGLGESPINAIVSATSGLLGYAAGFAIGSPFGGFPGFITGAAGGMAGEFIGAQLLRGLGKMPGFKKLTEIDDPLAKSLGLSPRPILRDPDVEKKKENDEKMKKFIEETDAEFNEDDIRINPQDRKNISLLDWGGVDDQMYSLNELYVMEKNGNEVAIKYLDARRNMQKMLNPNNEGHSTWQSKTTLTDSEGTTTVTDSDGFAKGGLVTPNQDISKKIKGKPTVWNNLYTEMTNNIKASKAQPMTSMVKPMEDPKVKPKPIGTSPTSAINNKVNTLTGSSEAKVQRSKETTTNTRIMVMRQQIIRSVQAPPPKVITGSRSPSPLIT